MKQILPSICSLAGARPRIFLAVFRQARLKRLCGATSVGVVIEGRAGEGKKNWLFMGSAHAGQTGAVLYTIIENCRRLGINPFDYLRDVLDRIPSVTNHQIDELTPEAWAKTSQPEVKRAA